MLAVTTARNTSATTIERIAGCPDILVMTTERPSIAATVTAAQTRKTGHPDSRTNQSVQLKEWVLRRVCADRQNPVKSPC